MLCITFKHMYGSFLWINRVVSVDLKRKYSQKNSKKLLEFLATMPKVNTGRITEAQKQRQHISKKSEKYGPSTVYLQVLGSGARGVPNTLYLFTDQKRYLFNCGECTQRLAHEHKVKLSRLEHIFITSKTWKNIGGLPGLSLTLQDVGVPNITLHGPEGLDELYEATKRFVIMKEMNVNMAKCTPAADFEDNAMTVKYVLLGPNEILNTEPAPAAKKVKREEGHPESQFEEFINDDTDYYRRDGKGLNRKNNTNVKPNEKDAVKDKTEKVLQDLQKPAESCVAYICTIRKRLGTLDLEKCVERGVKPGPLLGQLKSGRDVVLPDGNMVRSVDVKTPDDPGPVFIVLEVPDISYLREEEFSAHFDDGVNPPENIPTLIVHYTPQHIIDQPKYQAFMSMFGDTTKHLVLNSHNSCLGSEAVHRSQHRLHLLDEDIFPLLRDNSIPAVWTPITENTLAKEKEFEDLKNKIALAQFQSIACAEPSELDAGGRAALTGRTLAAYHLRPRREWDTSAEPKLLIQEYIQEAMGVDGFSTSLDQFKQLVESLRGNRNRREYPKVVFLGTGSCIPSKTRNTSGIALHIDENRSMLMDCGEGTFGQLVRFHGPKRVNAFLRTLRAVYISHLHADHHIGLIGVLQARREAFLEVNQDVPPLYLLAPGQIVSWLSMYDQQFEKIRGDYTLIPNQNLLESKVTDSSEATLTPALLADIGLSRVVTCYVAHCPNAFGVALHLPEHKITYSGDTIPCEDLVNIGKDSTLLIHEATMEDELAQEARAKMHSTTSQAIDIGRRMRANFTLLTHFSQRYARLPRISQDILADSCNVGIAFDNMQVYMTDLDILPHLYAPLQLMFAEHCVELEMKAAHRARRQERRDSSPNVSPERCTYRCLSPSCASTMSGARYVPYKDTYASKLRYELKRHQSEAITSIRSKSCSPSKYSTRLFEPFSQCNDIKNVTISRPASPNINYVKLNFRPRSSGPTGRIPKVDKEVAHSVVKNPGNMRNFSNTSLAREIIAKDKARENSLNRKLVIGRQSRPHTKMETQRRPIPSPSPVRAWKAFTTPILEKGNAVNVPNVVPESAIMKWDLLQKTTKSQQKRRSVSSNRSPTRIKSGDPSSSRTRSVSRSSTPCNERIQPDLRITEDDFDTYKKKQTICRNENLPNYFVKKYNGNSQPSFKPQLEDIKSSFLILNEDK